MSAYHITKTIRLSDFKTQEVIPDAEDQLKKTRKKIAKIQDTMYAHNKYSVLICLQGMDTSGKDSLISEVFKSFNTQGIIVHSFKQPTEVEKEHDFMWRHYLRLPERGRFAVFNRTHYENVLGNQGSSGIRTRRKYPGNTFRRTDRRHFLSRPYGPYQPSGTTLER